MALRTIEVPDMLDLASADYVEVVVDLKANRLWVNIDGECKMRVQRIKQLCLENFTKEPE